MLTGTNLKYTKTFNVRIVLETVRLFGPVARTEVARRTELTPQTVSNITRELIAAGLILEAERLQEGRGAPATLLKLNPDGAFSIGLDLDKDHLTAVLVDFDGTVRQRIAYELDFPLPDEAMNLLTEAVEALIERQRVTASQIWGVGVGLPGPLRVSAGSFVTNVVNPQVFPGWSNVPVVDVLGNRLKLPIYLSNNATAAAIGERWYGAGRHINTFFYVFFGAGLGGGLVINGQPFEGFTGNAGELGYYPANYEPDESAVFQRPHLGQYFNLPRLYRMLQESGVSVTRASQLEPLLEQGNPVLLSWLETGSDQLAPLLLAIEYIIDPQTIFLGGRLPDAVIWALLERLQVMLPEKRIEGKTTFPQLCQATAGAEAAALGAATLPLFTRFSPAPRLLMKRSEAEKHLELVPTTPM